MIVAILLGFVILTATSAIHYYALKMLRKHLRAGKSRLPVVPLRVVGAVSAHLAEAVIYAVGFSLMEAGKLGGFTGGPTQRFMDIYYFSLVNYTTLGLGDIYPTGHSRFLAGLGSVNGFLLISCSASLIFQLMQEHEVDS